MRLRAGVKRLYPSRSCDARPLDVQDTVGSPEEELQPQSSLSVLRRSFFEGGAKQGGAETEWEKRLASSPLRHLDSPMIEPLEPEEVRSHLSPSTSLSSSCCH